jgi:predicted DNA-binding transcriptional regulator AlpA
MAEPVMAAGIVPARPDDELIDRAELAQRLDLHPRTVRRMVARGELPRPCLSAGGRPRWLWSFVVEYCRKRHQRDDELDRRKSHKLK